MKEERFLMVIYRDRLHLFFIAILSVAIVLIVSGCSQPSNEVQLNENITKEQLDEALGVSANEDVETKQISQGEYNYPVKEGELDQEAVKQITIDDEAGFKEFAAAVNKGEYDDKVVSIEGYSACFSHRHFISVQNAGPGDTNVIMPESYVGIAYEINGTAESDYPTNAQQIKIIGKIMTNPAVPTMRVLITQPTYVEDIQAKDVKEENGNSED